MATFAAKGRILLLWSGLLWGQGTREQVGHEARSPHCAGARLLAFVEEATRSGALDSRHIWGSGQRGPPVCPVPIRGTATKRDSHLQGNLRPSVVWERERLAFLNILHALAVRRDPGVPGAPEGGPAQVVCGVSTASRRTQGDPPRALDADDSWAVPAGAGVRSSPPACGCQVLGSAEAEHSQEEPVTTTRSPTGWLVPQCQLDTRTPLPQGRDWGETGEMPRAQNERRG